MKLLNVFKRNGYTDFVDLNIAEGHALVFGGMPTCGKSRILQWVVANMAARGNAEYLSVVYLDDSTPLHSLHEYICRFLPMTLYARLLMFLGVQGDLLRNVTGMKQLYKGIPDITFHCCPERTLDSSAIGYDVYLIDCNDVNFDIDEYIAKIFEIAPKAIIYATQTVMHPAGSPYDVALCIADAQGATRFNHRNSMLTREELVLAGILTTEDCYI